MAETLQSWGLLVLTVTTIPYINGERWEVTLVDRDIDASPGENVVIQCKYTYPQKDHKDDIKVYWKVKDKTKDKENDNPFIFHTDVAQVKEEYKGRTSLAGEGKNRDCSLLINNMRNNESGIYVRIEAKDSYSFINDMVSVTVTAGKKRKVKPKVTGPNKASIAPPVADQTPSPQTTSGLTTLTKLAASQEPPSTLLLIISVPVASAVVVVIAVVTACVLYRKRSSRSQSLDRTSSGYYANFSRSTMNQTKRELSGLNKGTTEDATVKATHDEPVYSNLPSPSRPPPGAMETEENIYANM